MSTRPPRTLFSVLRLRTPPFYPRTRLRKGTAVLWRCAKVKSGTGSVHGGGRKSHDPFLFVVQKGGGGGRGGGGEAKGAAVFFLVGGGGGGGGGGGARPRQAGDHHHNSLHHSPRPSGGPWVTAAAEAMCERRPMVVDMFARRSPRGRGRGRPTSAPSPSSHTHTHHASPLPPAHRRRRRRGVRPLRPRPARDACAPSAPDPARQRLQRTVVSRRGGWWWNAWKILEKKKRGPAGCEVGRWTIPDAQLYARQQTETGW